MMSWSELSNERIVVAGDIEEQKKFRLALDKQKAEYERRAKSTQAKADPSYFKDSLYKQLIAGCVRNDENLSLEFAYGVVKNMVDEQVEIDMEIFGNAWRVIKAYAEGKMVMSTSEK